MLHAFAEISERLRRSTVQVQLPSRHAGGSGVIASADGRIVTNAHVATGDRACVQLWDGREFQATLLSRDPRRDLATLKIEAAGLPAAVLGDSNALRAGELVMALGNPMGVANVITTGIVHSRDDRWVMADVRLEPGNSGGPLADAHGHVVGINTMIVNGLGLAVPSNAVRAFLRRGGSGFSLGVTVHAVPLGEGIGLLIIKVEPDSPAAAAPLWVGDLLIGVRGRRFRSVDDLHLALDEAGGVIHLQFLRGDRTVTREVSIGLEPAVAEAA